MAAGPATADPPALVIFPTVLGEYVLAYRATMRDRHTWFVDAHSGAIVHSESEVYEQSAVGVGAGIQGQRKKVSSSLAGGSFQAYDRLRPAEIVTLDLRYDEVRADRLIRLLLERCSATPAGSCSERRTTPRWKSAGTLARASVLGTSALPFRPVSTDAERNRCPGCSTLTSSTDPEFRTLVLAARAVIAERVHRGVATPPERLVVAAVDEMPDEDDPAEVRAWAPPAAFRDAVRSVVLATLELYVGIVEALADEADREDGETMH